MKHTSRITRLSAHIAHTRCAGTATAVATQHPMLIGGKLVAAQGNAVVDVINPATGDVFDQVPDASKSDLDHAVASAQVK